MTAMIDSLPDTSPDAGYPDLGGLGLATPITPAAVIGPTGRYALIQCMEFGWMDIDLSSFTLLSGQDTFGAAR